MSHFTILQRYKLDGETTKQSHDRRKAGLNKIETAGYTKRYFAFTAGDEKAQQEAKADCTALAAKVAEETGVEVFVVEGFFA